MYKHGNYIRNIIQDSPVEKARKLGPCGNGNWAGFDIVYKNIAKAAQKMAESRSMYLSTEHIETMGDLGSGHEERMKYRQIWLITYGYLGGNY